ncbi:MAG: LamG-like jellyroll fold domain-containing protein, partial [Candidatus Kariarchaeaceae archaeon]
SPYSDYGHFDGKIDDVRIYNYALGQTEIAYIFGPHLVAHYKLDGNADDSSKFGNHGTVWAGEGYKEGVFGSSASFDPRFGAEGYMDLGDLGYTGAASIAFWFKKNIINSGVQYIFDGSDTGNWWLAQDYESYCDGELDQGGNICFNDLVHIDSSYFWQGHDNWYHVVITADDSETRIYLNTELIDTGSGFEMDMSSVRIGANYLLSSYFEGRIDDVQIFNYAIDQDKINSVYKHISPIFVERDFVRNDDQYYSIADLAQEILDFAVTHYEDYNHLVPYVNIFDSVPTDWYDIDTEQEKIAAIHFWAGNVLHKAYEGEGDTNPFNAYSDALNAWEVAEYYNGFDGSDSNAAGYMPSRPFDCRDMAALISGLATHFGLPSRMVSLDDNDPYNNWYQHYFTEIFGWELNYNKGWFLIDPSHPPIGDFYISSFDNINTISGYFDPNDNNKTGYFYITAGWSNNVGWGSEVDEMDIQASWRDYTNAPIEVPYFPNPWDLEKDTTI